MGSLDTRQRARRITQERGLGALANDTKWREFFARVHEVKIPLDIKLIDDDEVFECQATWSPTGNYIEGGRMGPVLYVFIEWVRSAYVNEIRSAARAAGLECNVVGGTATVYGYR